MIQDTIDSRHTLEEVARVERDKCIADLDQIKRQGTHLKKLFYLTKTIFNEHLLIYNCYYNSIFYP